MVDRVGQQLGSYSLTRLLGEGGFASVYLAEHVYLKTPAAIKVLYARLDPETMQRFLIEARHLSRLTHPLIVHLRDFAIEGETPFLVMDYAPGGTLRQRHASGTQVPLLTVVSYVKQIATALQHAHDHRLIHRDLKPENLLIGPNQEVLLGDFGIALAINSAEYMNISALSGTLTYMAPEQLAGKPQTASDQYSLGIMAYEWLSGERPFQGTLTEICTQHLLQPPAPLREKVYDLPLAVEQVVFRALEKDPQKRFPHLRAFAQAFEQASQQSTPILATSYSPTPETKEAEERQSTTDRPAERPAIHFHNLPPTFTSFIGRDEVRKAAAALLVRPEVRLLTMVGTGGIGKTSLAITVAEGLLKAFTHGVCFVPLAPLNNPDQVLPAIALALGLREQSQATLTENLKLFLCDKHLLLLLDNCEHLTAVAPRLGELLLACPQVKLMFTSRATLRLTGEQVFYVPPLDLPDLEQSLDCAAIAQYEAVRLFVERARAVKPDFQLNDENVTTVAEICLHLDGLPLAIELAASRIRLLSPGSLLNRLGRKLQLLTSEKQDIPARLQTINNTIRWSYDLLSQEEQQLFCRMAVFVDGFTLEAVEAMYTHLGEDPLPVLDGVASLLDKSLIQQREQKHGESRLIMLETLREFGLERLSEAGELQRCQQAHGTYYLAYIRQLVKAGKMALFDAPVKTLEAEYANIRIVLQGLITYKISYAALFLASALTGFWFLRGTLSEGRAFLEQIMQECPIDQDDPRQRRALAFAYSSKGWLAYWQNDGPAAVAALEQNLQLIQQMEQKRDYMLVRVLQSGIKTQFPRADPLVGRTDTDSFTDEATLREEGIHIFREAGDHASLAHVLLVEGMLALHLGSPAQARLFSQESLDLYRTFGYPWSTAANLHYLGWASYLERDYPTALALSKEAVSLFRTLGASP
ncbi:MAG TPA: protein kinase, partial [Ktedonosporobacter sp.]|nr:protein kinase [Ktedonosporobacter sp.]